MSHKKITINHPNFIVNPLYNTRTRKTHRLKIINRLKSKVQKRQLTKDSEHQNKTIYEQTHRHNQILHHIFSHIQTARFSRTSERATFWEPLPAAE